MNLTNLTYELMEHEYWRSISLPDFEVAPIANSSIISKASIVPQQYLHEVALGFYPLSALSPLAFKRVAELTSGEAKRYAQLVYEIEEGKHPFVRGTKYQNMPHSEQFLRMMESLDDHATMDRKLSQLLAKRLAEEVKITQVALSNALAYITVIEHGAAPIIWTFDEFTALWQVGFKRKSSQIEKNFLCEHLLTEGRESDEQHVGIVQKILAQYEGVIDQTQFDEAARELVRVYHRQLDDRARAMHEIISH